MIIEAFDLLQLS